MPDEGTPQNQADESRRGYLKKAGLLGAGGIVASVSGCSGDGGNGGNGGSGDLGPPVEMELDYWAASAYETNIHLDTISVIEPNIQELGIQTSIQGSEIMTGLGYAYNDDRDNLWDASLWGYGPDPARIDPDPFTRRMALDRAGPDGNGNVGNYASCEYTKYAIGQRQATSQDQRREWVNRAQEIASNDKAIIPLMPVLAVGAVQNNIEVNSLGSIGVNALNPMFLMDSVPQDNDSFVVDHRPHLFEDLNPLTTGDIGGWVPFMRLLWSPLVAYNPDLELAPILAEEVPEFTEGGAELTINLRDGLQFHNGDPITAEEVKWTFEFAAEHYDKFPKGGGDPGFDSVTAVDDTTLELTFPEPSLSFLTVWLPRWGMFHPESMESSGLTEAPADWSPSADEIVGSGPTQITSFTSAQSLAFGPTDVEHPVRNPEHTIVYQAFEDATSISNAFIGGELDAAVNITGGNLATIQGETDDIQTFANTTHGTFAFHLSMHFPPGKFPALRDAVGTAIDRQSINEIAYNGENEPETRATIFNKSHPWRAPDDMLHQYTDDPSGDIEAARQKLEDAGFGWDDDDMLHYPPDANMDPLWPAGEFPSEENGFPCANSDGDYTGELPESAAE